MITWWDFIFTTFGDAPYWWSHQPVSLVMEESKSFI